MKRASLVLAATVLLIGAVYADETGPPRSKEMVTQSPRTVTPAAGLSVTSGVSMKDLPDYEPLDGDEYLSQISSTISQAGLTERVDPFSGALHLNMVDIVVPGNAGLDIVVQRYYSSNVWNRVDNLDLSRHSASADFSDHLGGSGWQLHMGKLMNLNPGPESHTTFIMADGSTHPLYGSSAVAGEKITVEGWRYSATGGVHTIQTTSGMRYIFDSAVSGAQYTYLGMDGESPIQVVQCTRVEDLNGNAILIDYEPAPELPPHSTRITSVEFEDPTDQRRVVFHYNSTTSVLASIDVMNDTEVVQTWTSGSVRRKPPSPRFSSTPCTTGRFIPS